MASYNSVSHRFSPYKSPYRRLTRSRFFISVLIAVHLLTTLLPAGTTFAQSTPKGCDAALKEQESVAVSAIVASDEQVVIPKQEVDKAVFKGYWMWSLDSAPVIENLVMDMFIYHRDKMSPEVDNFTLNDFRADYRVGIQKFAEILPEEDHADLILHTILNFALDRPDLAPAVPYIWRDLMQRDLTDAFDYEHRVAQSAGRYRLTDQLLVRTPEILAKVFECAHQIPEVAKAFDDFHADLFNSSITDDAETIIERNPGLNVPEDIKERIEEDGSITISMDDLKKLTQVEFNKVHESISEIKKTLVEIDKQQDVIVDYIKNQERIAKDREVAKKKADEEQLRLDAAKAGFTILSTIAGQIDPEAGKVMAVTGTSMLQIGMALNKWLKATAGQGTLDRVASLSTVVMTGNVLGAVMNFVSLFGEAEPTPDQMILAEIGKLREQLNDMRLEMHGRFDRIDVGLNAIYTTMQDRFNQIDIQLGKINGNIQEVQESLLTLDLALSRIERNNFEFLNALGRRPLLEAINGALGYEDRTGEPMPYQPDFVEFENVLHSWATIHAFDPVNAGPTQRDYSDAQTLTELNAYPLDANLNYINGWLLAHNLTPISNKYLPSPRDWMLASRAYMQLALEWPEHMDRVNEQRQAELDQIGVELEQAMQNLSTLLTTSGPQGNSLLYTTVITNYQNKLAMLDSSIQQVESVYVNEVRQNVLQRAEPFDLYGGIMQPLSYVPAEFSTLTCGNKPEHGPRALSSNLKPFIPNFDLYNMADYLGVGSFSGCLSDEWKDIQLQCDDDPENPQAPPDCYWVGEHKAILTMYFDSVPLMRQTIDEGFTKMSILLPDTWTLSNWTFEDGYKVKFDALTTADPLTAEMVAQQEQLFVETTAKVETRLAELQQGLYQRVLNEMTQGSLRPTATLLAGARELIDAFTTLGLQRAVNNDEFLHAMLFGSQQLVDETQVINSYAMSFTLPVTEVNVLVNPRLVLDTTADKRTEVFGEMVNEYLTAITQQKHIEAADYIGSTRRALDLTVRIAQLGVPVDPEPTPGDPTPGDPTPGDPTPGDPTPGDPTPGDPIPLPTDMEHNFIPSIKR
jgi:hypothetical protein